MKTLVAVRRIDTGYNVLIGLHRNNQIFTIRDKDNLHVFDISLPYLYDSSEEKFIKDFKSRYDIFEVDMKEITREELERVLPELLL